MSEQKDDGVNREGLDYRAGWVEALRAFAQRVNVESLRAAKKEIPGMDKSCGIAREMFQAMLDKMRNAGK